MDGKQKFSEILRTLRRINGLTQRELAHLAGVPQPTVAAIESGQREPSLSLFSSIVESAGYALSLEVVPLVRFGALSTARNIREALSSDSDSRQGEDSALRITLSFRDALRGTPDEGFRQYIDSPPSLVGFARWDAFLAAVVEEECARRDANPPRWVNDPARFVKPFWHLSENPSLHEWEFTTAPASFIRHGVIASVDELASV